MHTFYAYPLRIPIKDFMEIRIRMPLRQIEASAESSFPLPGDATSLNRTTGGNLARNCIFMRRKIARKPHIGAQTSHTKVRQRIFPDVIIAGGGARIGQITTYNATYNRDWSLWRRLSILSTRNPPTTGRLCNCNLHKCGGTL